MSVTAIPTTGAPGTSRSIAEKLALGATSVGALIATSGLALLVILGASVELSSVISYLCWLGGVGVLASRRRQGPAASAALSALILVLLANQPYATGSLLNPGGNVGHFVGVLVILACALLAFGRSVAAATRSYRGT